MASTPTDLSMTKIKYGERSCLCPRSCLLTIRSLVGLLMMATFLLFARITTPQQRGERNTPQVVIIQRPDRFERLHTFPDTVLHEKHGNNKSTSYVSSSTTSSPLCAPRPTIRRIQMAAVPATASTLTDTIFKAAQPTWRKFTLEYNQRELVDMCNKHNGTMVEYHNHTKTEDDPIVACILNGFRYQPKQHLNYNKVSRKAEIPFTILKQPYFALQSHFVMKKYWDAIYESAYPASFLPNVTMKSWIENAWWRHNIFTKMLATDSQLIWTNPTLVASSIVPIQQQSDHQNALGSQSAWLQTAIQQLEKMPVFGLHHRLQDTFELFSFRLCFSLPSDVKYHSKSRLVKPDIKAVVDRYNVLDNLLLQQAEDLFDKMIGDMRQKKERGVICDLSAVLDLPAGFEIGLKCAKH